MQLKNLSSAKLSGKTILYRAPYDILTKEVNGVFEVTDDLRISATLPTLRYLLEKNCKIVILTYVGRPDGHVVDSLRTLPHAKRLSELLNHPVAYVDDCIGSSVEDKIAKMRCSDILMLENVRFHGEEMLDDDTFAKRLCCEKDLIVFDGFPQAHRKHASTTGIERHLPAVAGYYLADEVSTLSKLLHNPRRPFTVIIGGAKISDKVDVISNLLNVADHVLVGGAVANVFLKAAGYDLGASFIEDVFVDKVKREKLDWVEDADKILKQAESLGKKIFTPIALVISDGTSIRTIDIAKQKVPAGWMALDIGPRAIKEFSDIIQKSGTVFLSGPLGKLEDHNFSIGSEDILSAMKKARTDSGAETIIAGGDTIKLARGFGGLDDYSHISLAGGATLEFLAGKVLPALVPLMR